MARRSSSGIGGALLVGIALLVSFVAQYWQVIAVAVALALVVWLAAKWFSSSTSASPKPTTRPHSPSGQPMPPRQGARPKTQAGTSTFAPAPRPPWTSAQAEETARVAENAQRKSTTRPEVRVSLGSFAPASKLKSTEGDEFWVPESKTARFNGRPIGGFLYVGEGLASADGRSIEPALLSAKLRVNTSVKDCTERRTSYWPRYDEISPEARAALLNWLATGRDALHADIGYVFLYFYGLERRVLHDARTSVAAKAELPAIEREVRRLLSIYSENRSFRNYATGFLDVLTAQNDSNRLYRSVPPSLEYRDALTFRHRLGLAQCAADGQPLPPAWAIAWLYGDPSTRMRTPATRCRAQFEQLFALKYREVFGEGKILPKNRTRLKFEYRPASPGFGWGGQNVVRAFDLPDVSVLSTPVTELQKIAEDCTRELESYSRFVAKDGARASTFDAMVELPIALWSPEVRKPVDTVRELLQKDGRPVTLTFSALQAWFPQWGTINKAKMDALAGALGQAGVGIEPDVRFGGAVPDGEDKVVLFADDGERMQHASNRYVSAAVMLRLAVAVAASDGEASEAEHELLTQRLEQWLHLSDAERRRLGAYLKLLLTQPSGMAGLKKSIEPLDMRTRETMGDFLALLAQVDGTVTPHEVKVLEKFFKLLGLDTGSVYSKVHSAATEPMLVKEARPTPAHAIPAPPTPKPKAAVQLDSARIAALQADSERVSALLGAIFAEKPEPVEAREEEPMFESVLGLDAPYSAFVRTLLERSQWSRTDLEELAVDRGLMLDGALEHINEAALDAHDAPFLEGIDPVELNPEIVKELTHHEHQAA